MSTRPLQEPLLKDQTEIIGQAEARPSGVLGNFQHSVEYHESDKLLGTPAKVQEKSSGFFAKLLYEGGWKTKVARSLLVAGAAAGTLFLIVSNPVGWVIGTVAGTAFLVSLIAQYVLHTRSDAQKATEYAREYDSGASNVSFKQMAEFKLSAGMRRRGLKGDNYNHVYTHPNGSKLILGSLPSNKNGDLGRLQAEDVKAVLSINEPWERHNFGDSEPVTSGQWGENSIDYHAIDVHDHSLLPTEQLDDAADFIHRELEEGKSVYVHCRAGVGRSAMGIAAYLIKYQGLSANEAAEQIKHGDGGAPGRSQSTIMKKLDDVEKHGKVQQGLRTYEQYCRE